jgi:hypothetical protein
MDMEMNCSSQKTTAGMGNPEACATQSPKKAVHLRGGAGNNDAARPDEDGSCWETCCPCCSCCCGQIEGTLNAFTWGNILEE